MGTKTRGKLASTNMRHHFAGKSHTPNAILRNILGADGITKNDQ